MPQSKELNFAIRRGMVIAIIQDAITKKVLVQGFMDKDAWEKTKKTNVVHFCQVTHRPQRCTIAAMGGKIQVVDLVGDCDGDCVLILGRVASGGKFCETNPGSCFFRKDPELNFAYQGGLTVAVLQSKTTDRVVLQGFMDKDAWTLTQGTDMAHFWAPTREEIWYKSRAGNTFTVAEIFGNCDGSAVLLVGESTGNRVFCQEGGETCFCYDPT